jgi:hypothetical protein
MLQVLLEVALVNLKCLVVVTNLDLLVRVWWPGHRRRDCQKQPDGSKDQWPLHDA